MSKSKARPVTFIEDGITLVHVTLPNANKYFYCQTRQSIVMKFVVKDPSTP